MGVITAAIFALAGFAFALFFLSAIGLPGGVALTGASPHSASYSIASKNIFRV